MFRIEAYVEDKNVGEVLKRLTGIAKNVTYNFTPNVESAPNGKLYQTAQSTIELLSKEIHKQKLTELTGPQFRDHIIKKLGMTVTSYSHYANALVQAGILKKGKKIQNAMLYTVTGK